ncbi:MAG: PmbA/TldA family metallopeptidase [Rubrivivax sp.]
MPRPLDTLRRFLRDNAPAVDHVSIRAVSERSQNLRVRQDVPEAPSGRDDTGAMVTVTLGDAVGCGATSDLSDSGLRDALKRAEDWARASRGRSVFSGSPPGRPLQAHGMRPPPPSQRTSRPETAGRCWTC